MRRRLMFAALCAGAVALPSSALAGVIQADFNGDGFDDVATGARGNNVGSLVDAGVINVLYGNSSAGITSTGAMQLTQTKAGGVAEEGDQFGGVFAAGDFNGDSYYDLAIGTPYEDVGSTYSAGVVNVVYGSSSGLTPTGARQFTEAQAGGTVGQDFTFGQALIAADFNGDGRDDLAIGSPDERVYTAELGYLYRAGAVSVLNGSAGGLTSTAAKHFTQSQTAGTSEENDGFGFALAGGYTNTDAYADLVIGAPGEDAGSATGAGAVNVLRGSAGGLTTTGAKQFTQSQAGGASETGDGFGRALAVGNFNGTTGGEDLAIGVPTEAVGSATFAGVINVLLSTGAGGLASTGAKQFTQSQLGGTTETNDLFGYSLAAGYFNAGPNIDLAIGAPWDGVGTSSYAGVVNIALSAGASGLTSTGAKQFTQSQAGGTSEHGDIFGTSLAAGLYKNGTADGLIIGAPTEDGGSMEYMGVINVLDGSGGSLTSTGAKQLTQSNAGGTAAGGESFGSALGGGGSNFYSPQYE